jgi:hypothetical protein
MLPKGRQAAPKYRQPADVAALLTFFIAGLLFICASEHVDNLGAYTASRPETGLLIPSGYDS